MIVKNRDNKKSIRTLLMGMICLMIVFTIVPRVKMVWDLTQQKEELQQQKAKLLQVNHSLKKQNDELNSPAAVERIAREQLGMVKQGEKVVVEVVTGNAKSK
ncbi:MAG: septum formation initiator family protein [Syntrophomonas sp.]